MMSAISVPGSSAPISVRSLSPDEALARLSGLVEVLVDCVEGGASVSFMLPFAPAAAEDFWRKAIAEMATGDRALILAEDVVTGEVLGTAQVVLGQPENQPHRADVSKILVHRRARRRGVGAALMQAIDAAARAAGKTLLVLDTASPDAERLYERAGWIRVGVIPGYALMPDGSPCDTTYFYKRLA